jgi:hypothetical protein
LLNDWALGKPFSHGYIKGQKLPYDEFWRKHDSNPTTLNMTGKMSSEAKKTDILSCVELSPGRGLLIDRTVKDLLRQCLKLCKKRWVVERTFSWFNSFRRLDKDHEKTVQSAENMIYIAQIQILLNRNYR